MLDIYCVFETCGTRRYSIFPGTYTFRGRALPMLRPLLYEVAKKVGEQTTIAMKEEKS